MSLPAQSKKNSYTQRWMYHLVYCTTYARRHGGAVDVWWAKPGGIKMSLRTSILLMSSDAESGSGDALQQTLLQTVLRKNWAGHCHKYMTDNTDHA